MSSPNDPADVFIGYSRRDGDTGPALFSTLLAPNSPYASFMKLNTRFYDARLEAGEDWGEELEKHAAGCKVFIALVGPEWLKVLKERHEGEDGIPITVEQRLVTDWVYKELDLALERDVPAAVQIVCINGATFDASCADDIFPPGKVREYFKNPSIQYFEYRGDSDNQAFCDAVLRLLDAYHGSGYSSVNVTKKPTIFDNIDPWLRFISRENIWVALKRRFGVGMPTESTYTLANSGQNSMALLVSYDDRKDLPHELITGVSHHLYVKGRFETPGDRASLEKSSDECWAVINSFNLPANGKVADVYREIFNCLNIENENISLTFKNPQEDFVPALVSLYREKRLSPCFYTSIRAKTKKDLKIVKKFAESWDQLDWSELPDKLLLAIAIRSSGEKLIEPGQSESSLTLEPIGLISNECIEDWIDEFLQNKLRINNQTPEPVWWKAVQNYSSDESINVRLADVKSCFDRLG